MSRPGMDKSADRMTKVFRFEWVVNIRIRFFDGPLSNSRKSSPRLVTLRSLESRVPVYYWGSPVYYTVQKQVHRVRFYVHLELFAS